jgi:dTDP-4-dehydrorhamnose 3,5-epimerase
MKSSGMQLNYLNLSNQKDLIEGVILHKLKVNRDNRGVLVETLKSDWKDIFDPKLRPFAMQYYSITTPGVARDEDLWHVHKKQEDRFLTILGNTIVAVYDARKNSKTFGVLNLFGQGEKNGDQDQYVLLIPAGCYHGFLVYGKKDALLLNFPTRLYDPQDEGRIPHKEADVRFADGRPFSWQIVRDYLGQK